MRRRDFLLAALAPSPQDADRPQYHFLPPANWMNDPNAPVFHNGEYHMFYQHNPKAPYWDTMHWGHAVSRDMVRWKHLPIALAPTPGGPDKDGCFSGCMVMDRGKPVMVYTGVNPEVQCLATSDDWIHWKKHPRNPVIAAPPKDLDTPGFRDPQVWREGKEWLMALGAGVRGTGGTVLLYSSRNLVDWTYHGPILTGKIDPDGPPKDPVARGEMWECPDFFPVGDEWLLYVSTKRRVDYFLGSWKDRAFGMNSYGTLVHGPHYAPKSSNASGNRRIIWGWIQERRSREEQIRAGWSGVMSLPVVPSKDARGRLRLSPAEEMKTLREAPVAVEKAPPLCCEIEAELDPARGAALTLGGQTLFRYVAADRILELASTVTQVRPEAGEPLRLRLFCDGSVFEAFVNERIYMVARVYGARGALAWAQAPARWAAWPMKPISPDRLTS